MWTARADRSGLLVAERRPVEASSWIKQEGNRDCALTRPREAQRGSRVEAPALRVEAQHALEQLDVLAEVPWAEEQLAYARLRRCAPRGGGRLEARSRARRTCAGRRAPQGSRCGRVGRIKPDQTSDPIRFTHPTGHFAKLNGAQRRRLVALVRQARGRPSSLGEAERHELGALLATLEPRLFIGSAVVRLSPVPNAEATALRPPWQRCEDGSSSMSLTTPARHCWDKRGDPAAPRDDR
jgi:hypothetical protein